MMPNAVLNRPRNVAIVDDSEAVRRSLSVLLSARGYAATCFDSAEAFLDSPLKRAFDFLLIDYKLEGLTGTELLQRARAEGVETPAAMVSGWENAGLERMARDAGFISCIRKPMLDHKLFSVLGSVLGSGQTKPGAVSGA